MIKNFDDQDVNKEICREIIWLTLFISNIIGGKRDLQMLMNTFSLKLKTLDFS